MFKALIADKDAYITNRVIKSIPMTGSNTGIAGSLDLFKLYGATLSETVPNLELSRLLVHFDLTAINDLVQQGIIDPTHRSFWAQLKLYDVYGGETTPDQFTVTVSPLAKAFDEGHGKDIVFYGDNDICNFSSASRYVAWTSAGCSASGSIGVGTCDFYTGSVVSTQFFATGEEDLDVNVTEATKAILLNVIPNNGWRIAFSSDAESDNYSYFVKRFASRQAYNESKRPRLTIGFDDSLQDNTKGMTLDSNTTAFLFNYDHGVPTNIISGSTQLTGSNCIILKLQLPISGGFQEYSFTGSQHSAGTTSIVGVYSASFILPSTSQPLINAMNASGSINLIPIWGSIDGTIAYQTGSSAITVQPKNIGSISLASKKFVVSVNGLQSTHRSNEIVPIKVTIFDYTSPLIVAARTPASSPGSLQGIASDAFYCVKDAVTQEIIIPFDITHGSTRLSSDSNGMFFQLDTSNLVSNRTYVIDIMLIVAGRQQLYDNVSSVFKISDS